jgi:hypothetical protein
MFLIFNITFPLRVSPSHFYSLLLLSELCWFFRVLLSGDAMMHLGSSTVWVHLFLLSIVDSIRPDLDYVSRPWT